MKLKQIKPYFELIRANQLAGFFLLLWPSLISLNMAGRGRSDISMVLVFVIGSFVMRSAGCIINDIIDRKFDAKVERTKSRPIASGMISIKQALTLLGVLLLIAVSLLFFLPLKAILWSFIAVPLIILYPFCKRFTFLAQLVLGITFNLGVIIAWLSVRENLSHSALFLYAAMVLWTLGYDTIYAHQDREDDIKLGLNSSAIKLGNKTKKYVNMFYTLMITFIIYAFGIMGPDLVFYSSLIVPVFFLFWQLNTLDINDKANCGLRFKVNVIVGACLYFSSFLMRGF